MFDQPRQMYNVAIVLYLANLSSLGLALFDRL